MMTVLTTGLWPRSLSIFLVAVLMQSACRKESPKEETVKAEPPAVAADGHPTEAVPSSSDPDLDAVISELSAKWANVVSVRADITMTAMERGSGQNITFGGYGQYVSKKIKGKLYTRRDMVNGTVPRPGLPMMERTSAVITGPEFTYMYGEEGGKLFAQKRYSEVDELVRLGGRTLFNQLKGQYELKILPDAEVNGVPVHVLAGTPIGKSGHVSFAFASDSGAMVQMKLASVTGESTRTVEYANIELNPEIDDALFEYHPAPGVDMIDFTKIGSPP